MILSARPTIESLAITILTWTLIFLRDLENGDGRTYIFLKKMITDGRSAEWIN